MNFTNTMSILKGANRGDGRWTRVLRNWGVYAAAIIVRFKALAPYALMELILPGGSLMALLLWLYRRRRNGLGLGPLPMKLLAFFRMANPLQFRRRGCGRLILCPTPSAVSLSNCSMIGQLFPWS